MQRDYTASGAITKFRIVKLANDIKVSQASAATDKLMGVYVGPADAASDASVTIRLLGECMVEVSGTVNRGDLITSDSDGKGVTAAPSAGTNNRIVGYALVTGTDTTIRMFVVPSMVQGA